VVYNPPQVAVQIFLCTRSLPNTASSLQRAGGSSPQYAPTQITLLVVAHLNPAPCSLLWFGGAAALHMDPTVIVDRQPVIFPISILPPEPAANPGQSLWVNLKDSLGPPASNQPLVNPPRFRLQPATSHSCKQRQLNKANFATNPQLPPRLIRLTLRRFGMWVLA
jgi:hypothetical protein